MGVWWDLVEVVIEPPAVPLLCAAVVWVQLLLPMALLWQMEQLREGLLDLEIPRGESIHCKSQHHS